MTHDNDMPPCSLKTERAVLGALLIAPVKVRDAATRGLSPDDFHDPMYRRFAMTMKQHRRFPRADTYELCMLLLRIDGVPACGRVAALPKMVVVLKALTKLRAEQVLLLRKLARIQAEAAKRCADGENDL